MNFIIEHIGLYIMEKWKTTIFPIKACLHNVEELQLQALIWDALDQQARYCYENRPPG